MNLKNLVLFLLVTVVLATLPFSPVLAQSGEYFDECNRVLNPDALQEECFPEDKTHEGLEAGLSASLLHFKEPFAMNAAFGSTNRPVAIQPIWVNGEKMVVAAFDGSSFRGVRVFNAELPNWTAVFTSSMPFAGTGVNGLTVLDYNNDGNEDFLVSATNADAIAVFTADGSGSFVSSWFTSTDPEGLVIYDQQTVVTSRTGTTGVNLHHWNGTAWQTQFILGNRSSSGNIILVEDFNQDGLEDIVKAIGSQEPAFEYYQATGLYTFATPQLVTVPYTWALDAAGVFTVATGPQLVVSGGGNSAYMWRYALEGGTFVLKQTLPAHDILSGTITQVPACNGNSFLAGIHSGWPDVSMHDIDPVDGTLLDYSLQDGTYSGFPKQNSTFFHPEYGYLWVDGQYGLFSYQLEECVPDLQVSKTADSNVVTEGDVVTYTLAVYNAGLSTASSAFLTDTLPVALQPLAMVSTQGVCDYQAGTCNLYSIAPGDMVTVTYTVIAQAGGYHTNAVEVYSTEVDKNPSDNQDFHQLEVVGPEAQLVLSKVGKGYAFVGEPFTYTVSVVNNGPEIAQSVVITDRLEGGGTILSFNSTVSCTNSGTTYQCTTPQLGVGESITLSMVVVSDQEVTLRNSAGVLANIYDPNLENNFSEVVTHVVYPPECVMGLDVIYGADISGSMAGQALVDLKGAINSSIGVCDAVEDRVGLIGFNTGIVITTPLTTDFSSVVEDVNSMGATGGTRFVPVLEEALELFQEGRPGAKKVFFFVSDGQPSDSSAAILTAAQALKDSGVTIIAISFGSANQTLMCQIGTVCYAAPSAAEIEFIMLQAREIACEGTLELSKTAPAVVQVGEPITYTLSLINETGVELTNVVVTDTLPAGTAYVSGGQYDAGTGVVSYNLGTLAVGEQWSGQLVVMPDEGVTLVENLDYCATGTTPVGDTIQSCGQPVATDIGQPTAVVVFLPIIGVDSTFSSSDALLSVSFLFLGGLSLLRFNS